MLRMVTSSYGPEVLKHDRMTCQSVIWHTIALALITKEVSPLVVHRLSAAFCVIATFIVVSGLVHSATNDTTHDQASNQRCYPVTTPLLIAMTRTIAIVRMSRVDAQYHESC